MIYKFRKKNICHNFGSYLVYLYFKKQRTDNKLLLTMLSGVNVVFHAFVLFSYSYFFPIHRVYRCYALLGHDKKKFLSNQFQIKQINSQPYLFVKCYANNLCLNLLNKLNLSGKFRLRMLVCIFTVLVHVCFNIYIYSGI